MIASFGDEVTEAVFHGLPASRLRHLPPNVVKVAVRKLDMLNAARSLLDLQSPPGNRLERLRGAFFGFYNLRVNDQWRLVFKWFAGDAREVRLTDYH